MKTGAKIAIGCGVTALIALMCVVGFFVWVGYKTKDVIAASMEMGQAVQAVEATNQRYPFSTPNDYSFDPNRYDYYLDVRLTMIDQLIAAGAFTQVEEQKQNLQNLSNPNPQNQPGFGEAFKAGSDIFSVYKHNTTVSKVLDDHQMSHREYTYYLGTTLIAINSMAEDDPAMKNLLDSTMTSVGEMDFTAGLQGQPAGGMQVNIIEGELRGSSGSVPQETEDAVRKAIEEGMITEENLGQETGIMSAITPAGFFNASQNGFSNANSFQMQTMPQNAGGNP